MTGIGVLGLFLVFGVFVLVPLVLWILGLVDALRRPDSQWEAAGQNKLLWILVIVLTQIIGVVLYWFIARPALEAATNSSGYAPQP